MMCSPSVVEPHSMSRSIDHFSGGPTVVIRVVSNSMKAGRNKARGDGNGAALAEHLEHRLPAARRGIRISSAKDWCWFLIVEFSIRRPFAGRRPPGRSTTRSTGRTG